MVIRWLTLTFLVCTVAAIESLTSCSPATNIYITELKITPSPVVIDEPATLRWSVSGASMVEINNGIGEVGSYGNIVVLPKESTTYTLTASSNGQTITRAVTVTVRRPLTVTPTPLTVPIIQATDTKTLIGHIGEDVNVEGVVTSIGWMRPHSNADQTWVCVFFASNLLEGDFPGSDSNLSKLDYSSFFRAIIKTQYTAGFDYYPGSGGYLKNGDAIGIKGRLDVYETAPVIYLIDKKQVYFR